MSSYVGPWVHTLQLCVNCGVPLKARRVYPNGQPFVIQGAEPVECAHALDSECKNPKAYSIWGTNKAIKIAMEREGRP